ncbi:MAG: DUF4347 domain-containing protein [Cyanophyceae cyanobacterium]
MASETIATSPRVQSGSTVIFIDAGVEDPQRLKSHLAIDSPVYLLRPEIDGVDQITQTLAQYEDLQALYIVSHGEPGTLYLGNAKLDHSTLTRYTKQIGAWFPSLQHSSISIPRLSFYSCRVAATQAGRKFLKNLHQLTKATLYASSTPVGNSRRGGSWNLDVCIGESSEQAAPFESDFLANYAGVLGTGSDNKYRYYDSKELDGQGTVAFNDIRSSGTQLTIPRDQQAAVDLPFDFNFYGTDYSTADKIIIGENGGLAFVKSGTAQLRSNNANLPTTSPNVPSNAAFPFWDDLTGGQVHYQQVDNSLIIQWSNFSSEDIANSNLTFQAILRQGSHNIDFVYDQLSLANGATATIGLNGSNGSGLKYSFNQASLDGINSIRFITQPQIINNSLAIKEGENLLLSPAQFDTTDIDNSDPTQITYNITNLQHGQFRLNGIVSSRFTQQDINAGKVEFTHDGSEAAPSFSLEVDDGFNSSAQEAAEISFSRVNDRPILTNVNSSVVLQENALNTEAKVFDSNVTLTDVDSPNFDGGNLTVAYQQGGGAENHLSIRENGGSLRFNGSQVSFNGVVIGSVDVANNGRNGRNLVVNLTSGATLEAVEALIENLTYQNTSDTPHSSRTISITVNDGGGFGDRTSQNSVPATIKINVVAENDRPLNTLPPPQTVDEDNVLVFTESNQISVSDVDADNRELQVSLAAADGILSLNSGTEAITFSDADGTDGTLAFTGTIENINNALNGIAFTPTTNFNGETTITVATQDLGNSGAGGSLDAEDTLISVTVNAVNDAPVIDVPAQQEVDEDTPLVFGRAHNNRIEISDVDFDSTLNGQLFTDRVQVTLTVEQGTLTIGSTNNLLELTGNGTGRVSLQGTVADVNGAIEGITYRGNFNYSGSDTLTVTANDLGAGRGNLQQVVESTAIAIKPVNDAPVRINLPAAVNQTQVVFDPAAGQTISTILVEDPDSDNFTYSFNDDRFEVVDGQLRIKSEPVLTLQNETTLDLAITVTDDGTPTQSFTKNFTLKIKYDDNQLNWNLSTIGDLNNDGRADLMWRNEATGQNAVWYMNGITRMDNVSLMQARNSDWKIKGTGDFNDDGLEDLIWRNSATGINAVWYMNGTERIGSDSFYQVRNLNWDIVSVGDFNGDDKDDLLWRNSRTGLNSVWYMNNTRRIGSANLDPVKNTDWNIKGVGDFNGDGSEDLVWRNGSNGLNVVWHMNQTQRIGSANLNRVSNRDWDIAGVNDFNGDNNPDLMWRNAANGKNAVWYMNGTTQIGSAFLDSVPNTDWAAIA